MPRLDSNIIFKNSGELVYNDTVYDRLFELAGTYQFTITPKTKYWRFGIRFSKTPTVEFYHPQGRYGIPEKPEYPNIEIDAGKWPKDSDWQGPHILEFGYRDLPGIRNGERLDLWENYEPLTEVELRLQFDKKTETLLVSYRTQDGHYFERAIELHGFKFFKLFAWADKIEYELECTIFQPEGDFDGSLNSNSSASLNLSSDPPLPKAKKYWFLLIDSVKYNISSSGVGSFVTIYSDGQDKTDSRVQSSFNDVKTDDEIIGFDNGLNAAVCVFVVSNVLQADPNIITALELWISVLFKPYLPLIEFKLGISFGDELLRKRPKTLISLTQTEFKTIIESVPAKSKKITSLPFFMTEGKHSETKDQLEFTNDIESIASLIALKTVKPPLAIGLFGNWGSGKSFFMEKLEERIGLYAISGKPEFVKNVVQVKFDSWHYSDANLWASLISVIFESLNKIAEKIDPNEMVKLSETLEFKIAQRGIVESQKKELQIKVGQLQVKQKNKRERLEDISGLGLLKLILTNDKIKNDYSELNNPNIESIVADKAKIEGYIEELKSTKNTLSFYFKEARTFKGRRSVYVVVVTIVLFLLALFAKYKFKDQWNFLTLQFSIIVSSIAGVILKMLEALKPYRQTLKEALDRLTSLKKTIESREVVQPVQLTEQERELQRLSDSLQIIDRDILDTTSQINNIVSGKKLMTFIQDRSKDENYSKQLGLISWIRKDFDTLDKLLREQHLLSEDKKLTDIAPINPKDVKLKIDRIILYIDDLDRCNEDIVVRVLEAIHLLLAFPLFVVVVGVDPRWLNRSLDKKLSTQFGKDTNVNGNNSNTDVLQAATSFDYLEKIFQIPFSIKPINKTGRESLIAYLMKNEMEKEILTGAKTGASQSTSANSIPATPEQNASPNNSGTAENNNANIVQPSAQTPQSGITTGEASEPNTLPEDRVILSFKKDELEFIKKLSPIFAKSPRSINRYMNIYRIIRSHGGLRIDDQTNVKEYLPIMFLLAVIVGYSENAPTFVKKVIEAGSMTSIGAVLDNLTEPLSPYARSNRHLVNEIKSSLGVSFLTTSLTDFQKNIELISRFSFRPILIDAVES